MSDQSMALEPRAYETDAEVVEARTTLRTVADEARELQITDEASHAAALELLAQVRKAGRRIEALRKRWLDPLNQQIKLIRSDFDLMAAPAKEADAILSAKTSEYRAKVAEAARREQERLRLLAERRQARAAERAEARGMEPPPVVPIVASVIPPAKSLVTQSGSKVTYRKQVHFEIVDADAVPREWCCPDERKIGAAVRAGIVTPDDPIPGVRIWTTEQPVVR